MGRQLDPFPAFTASVANLRPESRGAVHIRSADPAEPPAIRPNYLSAESDRIVAIESVRLTRHIVAQRALARFNPTEFRPGPEFQSEAEILLSIGDISSPIFHPVGTAAMGHGPDAVVDDQLRVHGIANLRVADASVMPTVTSGNTNAPTMMMAEKAATMVLAAAKRPGAPGEIQGSQVTVRKTISVRGRVPS